MNFTYIQENRLCLQGAWVKENALSILKEIENINAKFSAISLDKITTIDTIGTLLIYKLQYFSHKPINLNETKSWHDFFLETQKAIDKAELFSDKAPQGSANEVRTIFFKIGYRASNIVKDLLLILNFIGASTYSILGKTHYTNKFINLKQRLAPYIANFNKLGTNAAPIIMLLSFIIGGVMAQQAAFQLRNFGAEIYAVNLTAILIFRELGVLLTSILIAGRCGSAITGELGVMQMQGETAALKVMGLDVFKKLYLPRSAAIFVSLPLLTLFSNLSALLGAAFISYSYSHISFNLFFSHLQSDIAYSTYFVGLIKAPFLAVAISTISIIESMKVTGSSNILAKHIISCVVKSIFSVIVIDGFMAIAITWAGY